MHTQRWLEYQPGVRILTDFLGIHPVPENARGCGMRLLTGYRAGIASHTFSLIYYHRHAHITPPGPY